MLARALPKYRNAETGADEEMTPEKVFFLNVYTHNKYIIYTISKDSKRYKQRMQDIECCFFFSLIWSIGKLSCCICSICSMYSRVFDVYYRYFLSY